MPAESGMAGISTIEPGGIVVTLPRPLKAPIKDLLRMYRRVTGNQQEQVRYQSSDEAYGLSYPPMAEVPKPCLLTCAAQ
jgi:hypothetical protein